MFKIKFSIPALAVLLGAVSSSFSIPALSQEVDVTRSRSGTIVTLRGTDAAENFVYRSAGNGDLLLIGRSGTVFNFEGNTTDRLRLPGAVNRTTVFLSGGNDRMVVTRREQSRMDINGGEGNDRIILRSSAGFDRGTIDGQDGFDVVVGEISTLVIGDDIERLVRVTSTPVADDPGPDLDGLGVVVGDGISRITSPSGTGERYVYTTPPTITTQLLNFNAGANNGFPQDVLDLSAIDADPTTPGNQAFTLVHAFTQTPGELRIPRGLITAGTIIFDSITADLDGDGVGEFGISIQAEFSSFTAGPWANNIIP